MTEQTKTAAPGAIPASKAEDAPAPIPMTEDGVPMVVNGQRLTDTQITALREARARRDAIDAAGNLPPERGGPDRPEESTRFGDWEKAGRAYDFS